MASYQIEWRHSTRKEIRRMDPQAIHRVVTAVESLGTNPFPPGSLKLSGSENAHRIRVGDYRVIYEVRHDVLVVEIIKVGHRRDVYQ